MHGAGLSCRRRPACPHMPPPQLPLPPLPRCVAHCLIKVEVHDNYSSSKHHIPWPLIQLPTTSPEAWLCIIVTLIPNGMVLRKLIIALLSIEYSWRTCTEYLPHHTQGFQSCLPVHADAAAADATDAGQHPGLCRRVSHWCFSHPQPRCWSPQRPMAPVAAQCSAQ